MTSFWNVRASLDNGVKDTQNTRFPIPTMSAGHCGPKQSKIPLPLMAIFRCTLESEVVPDMNPVLDRF